MQIKVEVESQWWGEEKTVSTVRLLEFVRGTEGRVFEVQETLRLTYTITQEPGAVRHHDFSGNQRFLYLVDKEGFFEVLNRTSLGQTAMTIAGAHSDSFRQAQVVRKTTATTRVWMEYNHRQDVRPFGGCLATSVLQSDLYHKLDTEAKVECDELIARWKEWLKSWSKQ